MRHPPHQFFVSFSPPAAQVKDLEISVSRRFQHMINGLSGYASDTRSTCSPFPAPSSIVNGPFRDKYISSRSMRLDTHRGDSIHILLTLVQGIIQSHSKSPITKIGPANIWDLVNALRGIAGWGVRRCWAGGGDEGERRCTGITILNYPVGAVVAGEVIHITGDEAQDPAANVGHMVVFAAGTGDDEFFGGRAAVDSIQQRQCKGSWKIEIGRERKYLAWSFMFLMYSRMVGGNSIQNEIDRRGIASHQ